VLPDGRTAPDLNEEYFLYQTLVGAWPLAINSEQERQNFVERIEQYMVKALHEAKVNLSWINPDPEYVAATAEFISRILAPATRGKSNSFLESIQGFLPTVQYFGLLNSLAQVLLKIASPGLPDLYQGTERWDFSLVDPDNRRPVNFNESQWALEALGAEASASSDLLALCARLLANMNDGRIKLWATARALQFRRDNPELFRETAYYPVESLGGKQEHVCAFARGVPPHKSDHSDKQTIIVAVPRFNYTLMRGRTEPPLGEVWSDTELLVPAHVPNYFENVLTGEMIKLTNKRTLLCREVFANFPVALLVGR
jgi:(1->4)-alpha-D-glucan 1-alpha-D-glucosylmutase